MRTRAALTLVLVLGSLCALMPAAAQDSLDRVRSNVREGTPSNASPPAPASPEPAQRSGFRMSDDHDSDDSGAGWFVVQLAAIGITSPYWIPNSLLDTGWDAALEFPTFPYYDAPGYLQSESFKHTEWWQLRKSRRWGGRVSAEYGDSFDEQAWIGGRALLDASLRFGIDFDLRRWEQTADPLLGDSLWIGKSDVLFRFAQNEYWQFRSGVGVNWLSDAAGDDLGVNFTYGVDWYPWRPLVFSSELDLGNLGKAFLFHVRSSAGVVWGGTELYVAYDYFDIGDAQLRGVATGLRVWF